jgi:hypothetical protein
MIFIPFYLDQFAILHMEFHATAAVAARTTGPGSGFYDLHIIGLGHFNYLPLLKL